MFLWVDPPDGWMYGFPKVICVSHVDEFTDWDTVLIENGYPANQKQSLPLKMWEATEDEVIAATATTLDKMY